MGVRFISLDEGDTVVAIARNAERAVVAEDDTLADDVPAGDLDGTSGTAGDEGTDQ
jgi:hypothetical protein